MTMVSTEATRKPIFDRFLPPAILIGLVFLLFAKVILSGASLYGSDFLLQFYPWKKFIYDHVNAHGALPFWNPYLFSGAPFITNIQASMFYPMGFLYYLIPPETAYLYSTILHCSLGALFMYCFVRSLSISRSGSLLSGIIFMFNGYFMAHLYAGHLSFVQNYIWIPLIFLFCWRFIQGDQYKYAVFGGLTLGVQVLGGFPQIAFYTIIAVILFSLYFMIQKATQRHYGHSYKLFLGLLLILGLGFSLSAVQLLPTVEFAGLSTRAGGVSYEFAVYDSLNPRTLISFLLPDFFGNPIDRTYWWSNDVWHFWETCGYVGVLPLFLVFLDIVKTSSIRHLRLFFVGIVLLSMFLALGKYNPIYPMIYKLPGFHSFRIPAQIIFLYVFSMAVLSGIAIDRVFKDEAFLGNSFICFFTIFSFLLVMIEIFLSYFPEELYSFLFHGFSVDPVRSVHFGQIYERMSLSVDRGAALFFLSGLIIILTIKRRIAYRSFGLLVIGIVIVDLYIFVSPFIIPFDYSAKQFKEKTVSQLDQQPYQGRVLIEDNVLWPNDALRYRFPSITGYDPLILRRYAHYVQASQDIEKDDHVVYLSGITNRDAKLLKLLNLKIAVSKSGIKKLGRESRYAYMVGEAITKSPEHILSFMQSEKFDAKKMIILEEAPGESISSGFQGTLQASVEIMAYENEKIRLRTLSNQPAYLVLSEIFYPGWEALVDGRDSPVVRGNYLYRAIPLDRGRHDVTLRFISWPFRLGLLISLMVLMASMWFIWRQRKVTMRSCEPPLFRRY